MVLRTLAKWYRRSSIALSIDRPVLTCDYCTGPIQDEDVGYHEQSGEVYHSGECSLEANSRFAEKSDESIPMHVTYMTIDNAIDLCRKGKLKQRLDE